MSEDLLPGYKIRRGSTLDQALLVKFMQQTYQEAFPQQDFSHLAKTVEQYFSNETPLWWIDFLGEEQTNSNFKICLENFALSGNQRQSPMAKNPSEMVAPPGNLSQNSKLGVSPSSPVACLWVGNAIDQVHGDRHAQIFLLYVVPEHRRQGIGTALMRYVEDWARSRGDHQIGLQVFQTNTAALNLYNQMGYQTQSLSMVKSVDSSGK